MHPISPNFPPNFPQNLNQFSIKTPIYLAIFQKLLFLFSISHVVHHAARGIALKNHQKSQFTTLINFML